MTTLLKGIGKLHVSSNTASDSPTDEDFIKCLDYDELERKFGCFKYYPKFLNNYDYSTPEIKEMIGDKPNPGTKKTFVTEIDVETGEMTVKEKMEKKDRKARREERRARREERRDDRKEDRKERKELRKEQKERRDLKKNGSTVVDTTLPIIQNQPRGRQDSVATGNSGSTQNSGPMGAPAKVEPSNGNANGTAHANGNANTDGFRFNNPFGDQSTLVSEHEPKSRVNSIASKARENSVHSGVKPRQNSVQTLEKPRKSTFSSKLRDMIMPHRHTVAQDSTDLQRTQSYDQTRSLMTFNRGAKTGLMKNSESARRMSEQIGTYT
ncbi:uncharacterized protein CXQ87_001993 [Candidozyma duobushaemuli]|uniref:Uncharacterized protein n=1 Tax=Candidozyma duobushaemuli TaxID=1231522 RepID=A0A2V1A885_9ASCO|nr:uncharacterized protein CXQ87_001993 [[Candida] duobushaemulonis]PVH13875.1 hypothetical protein CXQ87_001993 [[Candida] duobushaemulonis]